jgi:site-specific recombinase XerD
MRERFINIITLRGYSKATIHNYLSIFDIIVKDNPEIFKKKEHEIISYLANKIRVSDYSDSYVAQFVSVFNIVLHNVLMKKLKIKIPRPKKPTKQPDILSPEEMGKILAAINNIKHKAIIALMYSTGLRVSETCHIKISDIDTSNGFISVRHAKGDIERKVMLDKKILDLLRKYYIEYKPNEYLFNGAKGNEYSERSVQQIIVRAAKKVGIKKHISSHSLRHSCFTQLVRNGVDIRRIQKLAGHKQLATTARYLHISDNDVLNIQSPIQRVKI